jgi:hypothetical protein
VISTSSATAEVFVLYLIVSPTAGGMGKGFEWYTNTQKPGVLILIMMNVLN